jgi:prevent-host-death family protein
MPKKIGVAEVKKHFSEVVNEVSQGRAHFIIEKKGRPMAAMVSIEELEMLENAKKGERKKGLLAAVGAWEDFENLEEVLKVIHDKRLTSKSRNVEEVK